MGEPRIIKRYTNRKLYDTRDSRYVTLSQIAAMVRAGEEMTVIDNSTKEDLTSLTLAQIIYEQEKKSEEVLPISALRELVRRSEARLADLREGRVGRLFTKNETGELEERDPLDTRKGPRFNFDEVQRWVDKRLRTMLEGSPFHQLQEEMLGVTQRIEELEQRLRQLSLKRRVDINSDHQEVDEAENPAPAEE